MKFHPGFRIAALAAFAITATTPGYTQTKPLPTAQTKVLKKKPLTTAQQKALKVTQVKSAKAFTPSPGQDCVAGSYAKALLNALDLPRAPTFSYVTDQAKKSVRVSVQGFTPVTSDTPERYWVTLNASFSGFRRYSQVFGTSAVFKESRHWEIIDTQDNQDNLRSGSKGPSAEEHAKTARAILGKIRGAIRAAPALCGLGN